MRICFVCVLAACGGQSAASGTPITITFDRAPLLISVNDGTGWTSPHQTAPDVYTADVEGPYVVASVYKQPAVDRQDYIYEIDARTLDDDALVVGVAPPPPQTVSVRGFAVQPGTVCLGKTVAAATTPSWIIAMRAVPGVQDLVGTFGARAIVQRGVAVTDGLDLGSLDATHQGFALDAIALTATNAAVDETLATRTVFENATVSCADADTFGDAAHTYVFPQAMLQAGDRQAVELRAVSSRRARSLRQPYTAGASTAYALPTLFGDVAASQGGGPVALQWGGVADGVTSLTAVATQPYNGGSPLGSGMHTYQFAATAAFLASSQLTGVEFVTLHGLDGAWLIDASAPYTWRIEARRGADLQLETELETNGDPLHAP